MPRTISELVERHKHRTGESYAQMETRGSASGHRVHGSYLQKLARGRAKEWPKDAGTFTAIAAVLNVPEQVVVLGFAAEFGVPVTTPGFAHRIPPGIDELPEQVLDSINRLLRSLVSTERAASAHDPFGARSVTEGDVASGHVVPGRHDSETRSTTERVDEPPA